MQAANYYFCMLKPTTKLLDPIDYSIPSTVNRTSAQCAYSTLPTSEKETNSLQWTRLLSSKKRETYQYIYHGLDSHFPQNCCTFNTFPPKTAVGIYNSKKVALCI